MQRVPIEHLAARAKVSVTMVRYRVKHGQMSRPDAAGLFDLERGLRELAAKPKQRGGRRRGAKPKTSPETDARAPAPVLRDPATRFRRARAGQEEIKLAKMRGLLERVAVVKPRVFHLVRGDRDRLLSWVSRVAPLVAAEVRVDEGNLWRAIQRAVCAFLSDLAALEVHTGDEDEEAPTPRVREDAAAVPRDAETRFQLAKARQAEWHLARLRHEHVDLGEATRRLVAFRRRMLEELAAWVPRGAPGIAAEVGAEAAPLARAMARHLRPLQAELAAVDVAAALRTDVVEEGDDDDAEGENAGSRDGRPSTRWPRLASDRGPRRGRRRRLPPRG